MLPHLFPTLSVRREGRDRRQAAGPARCHAVRSCFHRRVKVERWREGGRVEGPVDSEAIVGEATRPAAVASVD